MKKFLLSMVLLTSSLFAEAPKDYVNCEILNENDKIICTYHFDRVEQERNITFNWYSPNGKLDRTKQFVVNSNYSLVYDYRFISGRETGNWKVEVIENNSKIKTYFYLEKYE